MAACFERESFSSIHLEGFVCQYFFLFGTKEGPRPKVVRSVADITAKVQTLVCYNVEVLPRVFQVPALGIQQLKTLQVGI